MKKIKSIYILFIFAAISSYSLWACTNSTTSERTKEIEDSIKMVEALDTIPPTATIDNDFYIKANIGGEDYIFNYLSMEGGEGNNLSTPNLFRLKRCKDKHCKSTFTVQAHNFDFNQPTPFVLEQKDAKTRVILSFATTIKGDRMAKKWQDKDLQDVKIIINKVEGDIFEGEFQGKATNMIDSLGIITGSFRSKMIIEKPAV